MNYFYRYIDAKYFSSEDSKNLQLQIFLSVMVTIAALAHVILSVYFLYTGRYFYFTVSTLGFSVHIIALIVNRAGKIRAASFIYVFAIIAYTFLATFFFGTNVNAQWLILLAFLPTVLYFDFTKTQKICLVIAMPVLVNVQQVFPELYSPPVIMENSSFLKFFFTNTIVLGLLVILAVNEIIYRKLTELRTKDIEAYKNMCNIDPLSMLNNRRYAEIYFSQLIRSAHENPCIFCLIDIDDFKAVNDIYGHCAGDIVIQSVAEILRRNTRQTDMVCRWGGEEFLVVMRNCSLKSGQATLEKIRQSIENEAIQTDAGIIKISITGGAKLLTDNNIKSALEGCDKKLYEGKQNGKNRIVS